MLEYIKNNIAASLLVSLGVLGLFSTYEFIRAEVYKHKADNVERKVNEAAAKAAADAKIETTIALQNLNKDLWTSLQNQKNKVAEANHNAELLQQKLIQLSKKAPNDPQKNCAGVAIDPAVLDGLRSAPNGR